MILVVTLILMLIGGCIIGYMVGYERGLYDQRHNNTYRPWIY